MTSDKLFEALESSDIDLIDTLLCKINNINDTFSKPNNEDVHGWTYLLHACKYGNVAVVELLLQKNSRFDLVDSDGKGPIYPTFPR